LINIFGEQILFYQIEGVQSDLLIGFNLLRKIGAKLDIEKGIMEYKGNKEKLEYFDEDKNDLCLIEEKNILPLKEYIIKNTLMSKRYLKPKRLLL